jgi:hypothetical protein
MSLLATTDFILDVNIPSSTYSDFDDFIVKYEAEGLRKILGYPLYKEVAAYDSANPNLTTQRIKDLTNGLEYQYNQEAEKYDGLKSIIKYYVYCEYLRAIASSTSNVSETKVNVENAAAIGYEHKIQKAWAIMLNDIEKMEQYIFTDGRYPEYTHADIGNINAFDL